MLLTRAARVVRLSRCAGWPDKIVGSKDILHLLARDVRRDDAVDFDARRHRLSGLAHPSPRSFSRLLTMSISSNSSPCLPHDARTPLDQPAGGLEICLDCHELKVSECKIVQAIRPDCGAAQEHSPGFLAINVPKSRFRINRANTGDPAFFLAVRCGFQISRRDESPRSGAEAG